MRIIRTPIKPGDTISRLTVLRLIAPKRWLCLCACGKEHSVSDSNLKGRQVNSCGCLNREITIARSLKHGHGRRLTPSSEYVSWEAMKTRCRNPNQAAYKDYGGRGVTVCERWLNSFENFLADMGPKPSPAHTLDRYPDPNGNYEPDNCRWATRKEQNNNKRTSVYFTYNDERLTVRQIADRFSRSWRYAYRVLFERGLTSDQAVELLKNGPRPRRKKRFVSGA